ncbi:MAG: hypothetical protein U9N85_04635 [Bacteroidota bacterium]|nr:hypothetical protein [Bacteroidota bacterium]
MKKPFLNVGYLSLFILAILVVMQVFPIVIFGRGSLPILDFEFAKSEADVLNLFFDGDYKHELIRAVNWVNRVDFLFMAAYSLFLLVFLKQTLVLTNKRLFLYALALPVLIFFADLFENIQMFKITEQLVTDDFTNNILWLSFFTYLKWLSLALTFLIVSWFYYLRKSLLNYIFAGLSVVPVLLGIAALGTGQLLVEKLFALSIFLAFGLSFVFCFLHEENASSPNTKFTV